jgi:hypothetical protein
MSALMHAISIYQPRVNSGREASPHREPASSTFDDMLSDVASSSTNSGTAPSNPGSTSAPSVGQFALLADVGPAGQAAAEPAAAGPQPTSIDPSPGVSDGTVPVTTGGGTGAPEPGAIDPSVVSDLEQPTSNDQVVADEFARAREGLMQFASIALRLPSF